MGKKNHVEWAGRGIPQTTIGGGANAIGVLRECGRAPRVRKRRRRCALPAQYKSSRVILYCGGKAQRRHRFRAGEVFAKRG